MDVIRLCSRCSLMVALLVTAGPARASDTVDAARLVEAYYTFQGVEITPQQLLAGIPAALELFDAGLPRDDLEVSLIYLFRGSDRAAWAAFEDVVPDWARRHAAQIRGTASWAAERTEERPPDPEPIVVVEPPPVEEPEAVIEREPVEPADTVADVVIDDAPEDVPEASAQAEFREEPRRRTTSARGLKKKQKTALIGTGVGLLAGGMLGGMALGVAHGYGCNYWPGGAPLIGLIPLFGPGASVSYWGSTDCRQEITDYYTPFAVGLTVLEVAGVTLSIVGAAARKRDTRRRSSLRTVRPEMVVLPTISPGSAGITFQGRF